MGLAVKYGRVIGVVDDPTWCVIVDHLPRRYRALWGFARKVDANIAVQAMATTGIDWNATEPELRRQWEAFGGREALKRYVCERLQW